MTLQEAYRKFDEVRDEFRAAKFAVRQALRAYDDDPRVHQVGFEEQITLHHLDSCARNLQITYLVRLFAEFESVLRDYWLLGRKRASRMPMIDLMNSIAAYCFMNGDDVQDAHEVATTATTSFMNICRIHASISKPAAHGRRDLSAGFLRNGDVLMIPSSIC